MKKSEMEGVIGNFRHYILLMHEFAGVSIPEEFDPEIQALACKNGITRKAQVAYATALLKSDGNRGNDLVDLTTQIATLDASAGCDRWFKRMEQISQPEDNQEPESMTPPATTPVLGDNGA